MNSLSSRSITSAIEKVRTTDARDANTIVKISPQNKNILDEIKQHAIDEAARTAFFKSMSNDAEKMNIHENHDMNLPNITSLDVDLAKKVKGFVEVDIAQNTDRGMTVFGYYGDKRVDSLKDYLSLLNGYIAEKSSSSTPTIPAQPTTPPEPTSPTPGTSPTTPSAGSPSTGTPTPDEPVAGADPNWTTPIGKSGQNRIFFPNVASLNSETAAAVYKQVSSMIQSQDISDSVIHARNGTAGTYSVDTYMSWLAQRAATNIVA